MKKIITALANPELNINLKKISEFDVVTEDIQYQEGVLETLDEKDVDLLVLSELLKGENNLKDLLKKIKQKKPNIKIILLLEKENNEKIKIAKEENVDKIFYHHKVSIDEMIFNIKDIIATKNIEKEIENLKKIIFENKMQIIKKENNFLKIKKIIKNKIQIFFKKENKKSTFNKNNNSIIAVAGAHGTGKSIISSLFAICLKKENKKTLLLDFDLLNQSINTLFGTKISRSKIMKKNNYFLEQEINNYHEIKIKINSHIDFISGKYFLLNKNNINFLKLNNFLESVKKEYDVIIIDISSECFLDYTKYILNKSDKIIFLTEGNLLEIKKAINLLNIYLREWNIKKEKINLLFNKYNSYSIDEKILNNIFIDFNILGKINFNKKYSLIINKNMKNIFFNKKYLNENKKILNKILNNKEENIYGKNGVRIRFRS